MNITPVFPIGEPNPYGKFFTGKTYLTALTAYDETFKTSLGNVKRLNSSRFFLSDTGRGIFDIFDIRVFPINSPLFYTSGITRNNAICFLKLISRNNGVASDNATVRNKSVL